MKKVLLTTLVAVFGLAGTAFAQFSQGALTVGGGLTYSSETGEETVKNITTKSDPVTTLKFSPTIGYFLTDDIEAGVRFSLERRARVGDDYQSVTSGFLFGPYARKYFSLGENTALFGEASMALGGGKNTFQRGNTTIVPFEYAAFSIGLAPGVMFRPTTRLGIELTAGFLGYTSYKEERIESFTDNRRIKEEGEFGLTLDMSNVALGLKLFF